MYLKLCFPLFYVLLLSACLNQVYAQGQPEFMRIEGIIYDTISDKPLSNGLAVLVSINDSSLVGFKRTDDNGAFEFKNLPASDYHLFVSHPLKGEREYYFFDNGETYDFVLTKILLPSKSETFDEITIFANKEPVYYKGDTLVFVADSFATKPNAVVEDLLKKLPGMVVNADGSITNQGKTISKVLVDGDEFFGSDPTIATKNLAANSIDKIHIYEKSDEENPSSDEKIQILDLKLKESAKSGYFGKVSGATDFRRFYEAEALFNYFSGKRKIAGFGLSSNTLYSSLSTSDERSYGVRDDAKSYAEDGIPLTLKTGVYFNDQLSKKLKIGVDYAFNTTLLKTEKLARSQYFLADTVYSTELSSTSNSRTDKHTFNLNLTYAVDSLTTLQFRQRLNYTLSENSSQNNTQFISEDALLSRQTLINNQTDKKNSASNTYLGLTRKFNKVNRLLNASYQLQLNDQNSEGKLFSLNQFSLGQAQNDTIDQLKTDKSVSIQHAINVEYIEPLTKEIKLIVDYNFNLNNNDQSRFSFNDVNGQYTEIDPLFSNQFETDRLENRVGAGFNFIKKKHNLTAHIRARNVSILNENLITGTLINQSVTNALPTLRYTLSISKTNRLTFNYNTNSSLPSVSQLQPVQDNTNTNRITIGNPDLVPTYSHAGNLNYSLFKSVSNQSLTVGVSQSFTQNAFGSSVVYDEFGRMISQTINTDGNSSTSINLRATSDIYKSILRMSINAQFRDSRFNNYVNLERNKTINESYLGGLGLQLLKDSIDISLSGNINYIVPKTSINPESNKPYFTNVYTLKIDWTLFWRLRLNSALTYTINSRRTEGYNLNYLIWNVGIDKYFGERERWSAGVVVYDIFNQNIANSRDISTNIITDEKTNIISRYFLVKVKYQFNYSKTVLKDENYR